jgi:hypothetical protein
MDEYKSKAYSEIIGNLARFFSGLALAITSFIAVAAIVAIGVPGDIIKFGGYELQFSLKMIAIAIFSSFLLLLQSCAILSLLFLVGEGDKSDDN